MIPKVLRGAVGINYVDELSVTGKGQGMRGQGMRGNRRVRAAVAIVAAVGMSACSGSSGGADDDAGGEGGGDSSSLAAAVEAIENAVPSVARIESLTEDTDPNDLLGRPNGYDAATVIYDDGAECAEPGADCGATVEQWRDEDEAQERSDYILGLLEESPVLGSEWHEVKGDLLLRISGTLKPSVADQYREAFAS